jgi:hypothetical protein
MKLNPKYSYEYNCTLNPQFNQKQQIENFASLISDKNRFLPLIPQLEKNSNLIESTLGYKIKSEINFYIVRSERFKSFSEPITIEYSILPEEMILYLLKEIIKTSITDRFFDETQREQYLNSFCGHIAINGDFRKLDLIKFTKNLHEHSKLFLKEYEFKDIDFTKKTMKQHIEELYGN